MSMPSSTSAMSVLLCLASLFSSFDPELIRT